MKKLSATFPVWFCDIWGVVHDGQKPFAKTCTTLAKHRDSGGTVILVTNSPRTSQGVEKQLHGIGVDRSSYDAVVTSGDVTRTLMVQQGGGKLFHLGPARDSSIFTGLDVEKVELQHCTAVLCTGLFDDRNETPADYLVMLADIKNRALPFICANPDKVVRIGPDLIYCAGALAEEFSKLGGNVLMAGKPFTPIYDLALRTAEKLRNQALTKDQILGIGDGPETDIKGATDYGLACVLITGGINSGDDIRMNVENAVPNARILADMPELDWV
jgi:HAD superfamily hydrolase (TIGR01459 family)